MSEWLKEHAWKASPGSSARLTTPQPNDKLVLTAVDTVAPCASVIDPVESATRLRSEQRFQLSVDELRIGVVQPRAGHVTPQRRDDDVARTSNM